MDLKVIVQGDNLNKVAQINHILNTKESVVSVFEAPDIAIWISQKMPDGNFQVWMKECEDESFEIAMQNAKEQVINNSLHVMTVHNIPTFTMGNMHLIAESSGSIYSFQKEHEMEAFLMDRLHFYKGE